MGSAEDKIRPLLHELVLELESKYPYASALVTRSRMLNVASSSKEERVSETGPAAGVVFAAWDGECFREVATNDLSRDGMAGAAKSLLERASPSKPTAFEIPARSAANLSYVTPMRVDPATISLEQKVDLCRKGRERAASLDTRVVDARCGYMEEHVETLFVNRFSEMSQEITRVSLGFLDTFRDGDVVRQDGDHNGGTGGYELATIEESQWEGVASRIPCLLKSTPVEPGYYHVVASPSAAGMIAHEAFGHGVETDMFLKGRAKAREYLGKAVGSGHVNLYDDPTYPGGYGTYGFDDEGQPASSTQILKNGVFIQGLTDLNSATCLRIARTANGRRQDINKVYPRMTNTYFGCGQDTLDDMVASIDHGIYLGSGGSGMEDPKDWGIQCIVAWGRVIEDGKLTDKYHTHVGLTGYVPDLLGSVDMVGDGIRLYGGVCGKGHKEFMRVGMGGPHLRMKARLG